MPNKTWIILRQAFGKYYGYKGGKWFRLGTDALPKDVEYDTLEEAMGVFTTLSLA